MGELIDLDDFRVRDAPLESRDLDAQIAEERACWLRDLEQWPVVFHEAGRHMIDRLTDPDTVRTHDEVPVLQDAREAISEQYAYPTLIWHRLDAIRRAIRDLREAQAQGKGAAIEECREALQWEQDDLLGNLWLFGKRRIERADLEAHARKQVWHELRERIESASRCDEYARTIRARLAVGVHANPRLSKASRALSPSYRRALEGQLEGSERIARKHRDRVREIQSTRDPLRAWGLYR